MALVGIHSFVRYVVLLVAVTGIALALSSLSKKEPTKTNAMVASAFVGLYDLQVLLGLLIILLGGLNNALHPIVMFTGAVVAHAVQAMSKRAPAARVPAMRLVLYIVPLAIILTGLAVINHLPV